MSRLPALSCLALLGLSTSSPAQESRFDLGQRLRSFEREYDQVTEAAARKRTVAPLKQATASFFLGTAGEAARGLDQARLLLRTEKPEATLLWAESLVLRPEKRLVNGAEARVSLTRLYRSREKQPEGVKLRVSLVTTEGKSVVTSTTDIKDIPLNASVSLKDIKEGDYTLRGELILSDRVLARGEQTLAVTEKLTERLDGAERELQAFSDRKTTDVLTARTLLGVLRQLAKGETLETNYPAARLLAELEGVLAALKGGQPFYGKDRPGQYWLQLAVGSRGAPVRVQVPAKAREGKPLPLVIAMHGAGGSENMFFDGYGDGAVARLSAERGWILVTTRNGLTEGVIDELARLYPIDRKKVFLIGHSMGAGQAMAAASVAPEKYAGVAALGGGGRVRASDGLKKVAFYVGIGKEDFALGGARSLKRSLEQAKVEKLEYRELDDVEHLVVVQVCLPEVFRFFDAIARG